MRGHILSVLLAACGANASEIKPEVDAAGESVELTPEQRMCSRGVACGLVTASNETFCTVCVGWVGEYLTKEGYPWRAFVDHIESAGCDDLRQLGYDYNVYQCIGDVRKARYNMHIGMP